MSWGDPFRTAWDAAPHGARAAAREAVNSPEKAAGLMSDAIAHMLQRTQYAARDVQHLQQAAAAAAVTPPSAALRSAMEDLRLGKIPPERAEKHLQQALHAIASHTAGTGADSPPERAQQRDDKHAVQRFGELRKRLLEQLDEAQRRWPADSLPPDARANAEFADCLGRAFALIDDLFLENKLVDDPVVPLPAHSRPVKEEALCRPPPA